MDVTKQNSETDSENIKLHIVWQELEGNV